MDVPHLGEMKYDEEDGWYRSQSIRVAFLAEGKCVIVLEGYVDDNAKGDFHVTIQNLLRLDRSAIEAVSDDAFQYYHDAHENVYRDEEDQILIDTAETVWEHVDFGDEIHVSRRHFGDRQVYASIECNCDWEDECGLQIVLKNGKTVCKLGPYDGHLTNSDAYDDDTLENVVYKRVGI